MADTGKQELYSVRENTSSVWTGKSGRKGAVSSEKKYSGSKQSTVPNRKKKRIFDRFYRGNASTRKRCHYGLGLAVAQELTTLHEGKLWVEDTPGGGAKFCLSLKAQTRKK